MRAWLCSFGANLRGSRVAYLCGPASIDWRQSANGVQDADMPIELAEGDLTRETTDAIVNAANSSLLGGGGVDGAIHRAGGPRILEACREIRARRGELPPGEAVATTGGALAARYVIHTVGPIWRGGGANEPEILASAYRSSMQVAEELALSSVAFPSISTGAYGYPVERAAPIAIETVRDALSRATRVTLVRFVLFDAQTLAAYEQAIRVSRRAGRS
jgi:O-acetyl-ADP-ribose deacetylase (regulator of RNase III)